MLVATNGVSAFAGGELPSNRCEKPSQMMEEKCPDLYAGLRNRLLKRAALVFFD